MKYYIAILLISFTTIACTGHKQKEATELCNCYTLLHRTRNEVKNETLSDSCSKLYMEILDKFKEDDKELKLFWAAYEDCQ